MQGSNFRISLLLWLLSGSQKLRAGNHSEKHVGSGVFKPWICSSSTSWFWASYWPHSISLCFFILINMRYDMQIKGTVISVMIGWILYLLCSLLSFFKKEAEIWSHDFFRFFTFSAWHTRKWKCTDPWSSIRKQMFLLMEMSLWMVL